MARSRPPAARSLKRVDWAAEFGDPALPSGRPDVPLSVRGKVGTESADDSQCDAHSNHDYAEGGNDPTQNLGATWR